MFPVLNIDNPPMRGYIAFNAFQSYQNLMKDNLERVKAYHRNNSFYANEQHILVRLLKSIPLQWELSDEDFYAYNRDYYFTYTNPLHITSPVHAGTYTNIPHIMGGENIEFPIVDLNTKYVDLTMDWKTIEAVKVMRHNRTDLSFNFAQVHRPSSIADGIVIYKIDLPLLAHQYRAWFKTIKDKATETTNHFVFQYVLPGIIGSIQDVGFLNRVAAMTFDKQVDVSVKRYIMALPDAYKNYDYYLRKIVQDLSKGGLTYQQILFGIKPIQEDNLLSICQFNDVRINRNNRWLGMLTQLPLLSFMFNAVDSDNRVFDKTFYNRVLQSIRLLQGEKGYGHIGNKDNIMNRIDGEFMALQLMLE